MIHETYWDEDKIKFWQDKNKHEVDIILDGQKRIPIEVKYKIAIKNEDFIGINAFLKEYPKVKKGYLINFGSQKKINKINILLPFILCTEIKKSWH